MAHDLTDARPSGISFSPSRRSLVGGLAGGAALAVTGLPLAGSANAHGTITSYPGVGGVPTFYININDLTSFGYRPSFHDQMGQWMDFWAANVPSGFGAPYRVGCLGVHYDSRVTSAHNNGVGFDLTHIYTWTGTDSPVRRFYARRDIWMNCAATDVARELRLYWATAASVHRYFRDVLTYGSNPSDHSNHIHLDNEVAGPSTVSFSTGSSARCVRPRRSADGCGDCRSPSTGSGAARVRATRPGSSGPPGTPAASPVPPHQLAALHPSLDAQGLRHADLSDSLTGGVSGTRARGRGYRR